MKKELTWKEHIERCFQLQISKKAYCEKNNLSYQLFFYHQRKLVDESLPLGFQEITLQKSKRDEIEFENEGSHVLQVQFANGNTLLFSEHLLERVFCLLQSHSE